MNIAAWDTLQTLTGCKQRAGVKKQLSEWGVRFVVAADGKPRVAEAELERMLVSGAKDKARPTGNREALAALQRRA